MRLLTTLLGRLDAHMLARFPARPLAIYRIILGLCTATFTIEAAIHMARQDELASDFAPFIPGIDGSFAYILADVVVLFAITLTVGLWTRTSAVVSAALVLYTMYFADRYQNHLAFLASMLLVTALTDSGRVWSIDAIRSGLDQSAKATVAAWPVTLVKTQLCLLYLFAGINKLNPVFWTGDTIRPVADRSLLWPFAGDDRLTWVYVALGTSGLIWELTIPFALWIKGLPQKLAMIAGPAFHIGMAITLGSGWARIHGVAIFAIVALATYLLFEPLGPKIADRIAEWALNRKLEPCVDEPTTGQRVATHTKVVAADLEPSEPEPVVFDEEAREPEFARESEPEREPAHVAPAHVEPARPAVHYPAPPRPEAPINPTPLIAPNAPVLSAGEIARAQESEA